MTTASGFLRRGSTPAVVATAGGARSRPRRGPASRSSSSDSWRLGARQVARRRPVAAPRHARRHPRSTTSTCRRSTGGSPTTCRCPTSGTSRGRFVDPAQRAGRRSGVVLAGQAAFTFGEALAGFVLGGILGLALGILFVHSRLRGARLRAVRRRIADRAAPRDRAALVVVARNTDSQSALRATTTSGRDREDRHGLRCDDVWHEGALREARVDEDDAQREAEDPPRAKPANASPNVNAAWPARTAPRGAPPRWAGSTNARAMSQT